jgi:aconitate hydratase
MLQPASNRSARMARVRHKIDTPLGKRTVFRLDALGNAADLDRLPYSIRVLLEAVARNCDGMAAGGERVDSVLRYNMTDTEPVEIDFFPGRVLMQDLTGVPAIVDLAAMRSALARLTGDEASAGQVNPRIPVDLVVDHSVQVDVFNSAQALLINSENEFARNRERYAFLKWGQSAFDNLRIVPPATGIVHQVNLEYLARVVWERDGILFPDSVVGTDSHTTMINGLGVLGWGVGGIEAEAAMLGRPISMLLPEVVGFRLTGRLSEGATATDLVLTVTEQLRRHGVVGKFVEFHGPGLDEMPVANRATIANMCPEYGATVGLFPIDDQTLHYLRLTGRDERLVETVELYSRLQGLWRDDSRDIAYSSTLELDMGSVGPSLAGPRRPQDRVDLDAMNADWRRQLDSFGAITSPAPVQLDGEHFEIDHGSIVIAAITSCTNTSNPDVMIGAGLVARKARERGLTRKPWVKTSLAPGSTVVTRYLTESGLLDDLEALGFHVVGYGCTTCIGNSGPLPEPISRAINDHSLVAVSVLSGNRNFEGRVSPDVRASYLASPPLVVAYAIAGSVDIDLTTEPLGTDADGAAVYLRDVWPTQLEIDAIVASSVSAAQFTEQYAKVFEGQQQWQAVDVPAGHLYSWDPESTYIHEPPFFADLAAKPSPLAPIEATRVLLKLGDSVTTDHISPAGFIPPSSPAGRWLASRGMEPATFNSYGSRRGNDLVMTRGTFANTRIRNQLAPSTEGGFTTDFTDGQVKTVYEASLSYGAAGIPLVVLAGKDYGMGSSRDWAAKGTQLLGVKAVLAESFERIHRSNLVMVGVLPLAFPSGGNADRLGLDGTERYDILIDDTLAPRQLVTVHATKDDGTIVSFDATAQVETPVEVEFLRHGGILRAVVRTMAAEHRNGGAR